MRIALTYDLRSDYVAAGYSEEQTAEFDSEATLEGLEEALGSFGHVTERVGRLSALIGRLGAEGGGLGADLVFNIAEGIRGIGREAAIPAVLDAYGAPYTFSDPMVMALTLHKGMTKRIVRDLGLSTAGFAVVEREGDADEIDLPFPLFIKPVAEGTSKGISTRSRVMNQRELQEGCARLLAEFQQPVLVETYLPGREFTIGVVGTGPAARALGTMEVKLAPDVEDGIYTHEVKERWEGRVWYSIPNAAISAEAEGLALAAWRGLGCRDGGRVDVRADASGRLQFLEVNPLPGLNPVSSDLPILCGLRGIEYRQLVGWIVESASERVLTRREAVGR